MKLPNLAKLRARLIRRYLCLGDCRFWRRGNRIASRQNRFLGGFIGLRLWGGRCERFGFGAGTSTDLASGAAGSLCPGTGTPILSFKEWGSSIKTIIRHLSRVLESFHDPMRFVAHSKGQLNAIRRAKRRRGREPGREVSLTFSGGERLGRSEISHECENRIRQMLICGRFAGRTSCSFEKMSGKSLSRPMMPYRPLTGFVAPMMVPSVKIRSTPHRINPMVCC